MSVRLEKSEKIIDTARRHGIIYFWWWILIFILIVTPFFFMFWLLNHNWWGQSLFAILLLSGIFILVRTFFLWKRNAAIITTHRVIDVDQRGFFDKFVSEMPYDELDYVSGHVKGFWGTIWRYGVVSIQNENGNMKIILDRIKQPVHVQQKINELRKRHNVQYFDDSICLECEIERGDTITALENKFHELEVTELIKLKKKLDKKIRKLLER